MLETDMSNLSLRDEERNAFKAGAITGRANAPATDCQQMISHSACTRNIPITKQALTKDYTITAHNFVCWFDDALSSINCLSHSK